eukprot:scaffold149828_cov60-Attheya_sp.AAC.2
MDPSLPTIDYSQFRIKPEDFTEHYRDAEEELLHRMPKARGRSVTTTSFVDASHTANRKTRKSHTRYLIFLNQAPVLFYSSKRQQTVEASTVSSEFIAMKACIEAIEALRFKLLMFGVPLPRGEPTHVFCDNESVVKNSTSIESTLNKKHSSIAYHYTRWSSVASVVSVAWINTQYNLADAFTKHLSEMIEGTK